MKFNKNEEAVSPVIGVILMVAITVILAAVIAVFVFGMADNIQTTHTVATTAQLNGADIVITFQGGPDAAKVTSLNMSVYNSTSGKPEYKEMTNPPVGNTTKFAGANTAAGQERVLITATFNDGSTQVILDKYV